MLVRTYLSFAILLSLALLLTYPLKAQVEPSASGGPTVDDDSIMITPPPVSGMPYPTTAGSDTRSNYLSTSVTVSPAYVNNVQPDVAVTPTVPPIGDFSFTISPSVSLDRSTPRQMEQITYSPYFSFYEPTSTLDTIDQSASGLAQFRLTPHLTLSIRNSIVKTSDVFNASNAFSSPITGSVPTSTPAVIAPFVETFITSTTGVVSYQFAAKAMIGGGVSYDTYNYPDQAQTQGLYDSRATGGSAFYSRRLTRTQYAGLTYEYERVLDYPQNATNETQVQTFLPYYTLYFNRTFSLSISAGMQHINETESPSFQSSSWRPTVVASLGWQGRRGSLAGNYSQSATAGGGILGVFKANTTSGTGNWKLSQTWTGSVSASYRTFVSIGQSASRAVSSNYTVAQATVTRSLGTRMYVNFGYQHLSQNYTDIAVLTANPNSNREFVSVNYQLTKALGR
jgi:hypothetical protein